MSQKKETIKTALNKYERSSEDKKADLKGAKKMQAQDNKLITRAAKK